MPVDQQPTIRRRRLGAELRRLREAAGLSLEQVAQQLECHRATISRLELGRSALRSRDLRHLLTLYAITDQGHIDAFVTMARTGRQRGWWQQYQDTLPPTYTDFIALESEATYLRVFQPLLLPGLLQTENYARAVTRTLPAQMPDEKLDLYVRVRSERRSIIDTGKIRFCGIVSEAALRTPVGGPEAMQEQLRHLLKVIRLANVSLQVLPFRIGEHAGLHGPFVLMSFPLEHESDIVYLENLTSSLYLEKLDDVQAYTLVFDSLRSAALSPRDSEAAIIKALNALGSGETKHAGV
jgi:transcriptional regulator with XRE-family HTH domain